MAWIELYRDVFNTFEFDFGVSPAESKCRALWLSPYIGNYTVLAIA